MKRILVLLGAPGAGKSTLLAAALGPALREVAEPLPLVRHAGDVAQIGAVYDRGYPGADVLGRDGAVEAMRWLCTGDAPARIVAEGIHFCTAETVRELVRAGWQIDVVFLDAAQTTARERRALRGKPEHTGDRWYAAIATAQRDLAEQLVTPRWRLDATLTPERLTAQLRAHPFFRAGRS